MEKEKKHVQLFWKMLVLSLNFYKKKNLGTVEEGNSAQGG